MKLSKLISALQRRLEEHGDVEVEVTWEGGTKTIENASIYKSKCGSLYIDADDNYFKSCFAVDPNEGSGGQD